MNVTFACPRCHRTVEAVVDEHDSQVVCSACDHRLPISAEGYANGELRRCLVCPSTDLFVRKDFPQRLGVSIVVLGFAVSCVTWYFYLPYWTFAALFATALLDVALWFVVKNCLSCYRCDAQYRGLRGLEKHAGFDLETHERHRQQLIRLRQADLATRRAPDDVGAQTPS